MERILTEMASCLARQSCQVAIVFVAVAAACWLLRRASAHWRYLLWLVVLAKCLAPPLVTARLPVLAVRPTPPAARPGPEAAAPTPSATAGSPSHAPPGPTAVSPAPTRPTAAGQAARDAGPAPLTAPQWAAVVWLVGAAGFIAVAVWSAWRLHRRLRRRRRSPAAALCEEIARWARGLGLRRAPKVWIVDGAGQPFVWGLLRGDVYVPSHLAKDASAERRRLLLAHEVAHVARFDALVNAVQVLVQALFFFHPLVWWANRRLRQEREACCDEMAVAAVGAQPSQYGAAILDTLAADPIAPTPFLAVAGPVRDLEERMRTIMRPHRTFHKRPSWQAILVASLLAALVLPTGLTLAARARAAGARPEPAPGQGGPAGRVPANLARDLVFYYSLDQDEDERVTDLSGRGNHGKAHGVRFAPEDEQGGAAFDGQNDYIQAPDLQLTRFTFAAIVKLAKDAGELDKRRLFLVEDGDRQCSLESNATGALGLRIGRQAVHARGRWLAPGAWTHVAVTYDGRTVKLYRDGTLGASAELRGGDVSGAACIGGTDRQGGRFWHGMVDEAVLLSRDLTAQEVELLCRAALAQRRPTRPRYFVRIVLGRERTTFEGRPVGWGGLPAVLQKVPDRPLTVLEVAVASRRVAKQAVEDTLALAERFDFEYGSYVGRHPLGSKGTATQRVPAGGPDAEAAELSRRLVGLWAGMAIDKPGEGTSEDPLTVELRLTDDGRLEGAAYGAFARGGRQDLENVSVRRGRLCFEVAYRAGGVMGLSLVPTRDRLVGEARPVDEEGDSCDVSLRRIASWGARPRPVPQAQARRFAGRWRGVATDKPGQGTSKDAIQIVLKANDAGVLTGTVSGRFANGEDRRIWNVRLQDNRLRFELIHRTGVRMQVTLEPGDGELRGDAVPMDVEENPCDIVLKRQPADF